MYIQNDSFQKLQVRIHAFYAALHKHGAYMHLMNEEDKENLKWLHVFK